MQMEAMAASKEVWTLYSANVWGETFQSIGFEKFGRLCVNESTKRFSVKMGHEHVMYTMVHNLACTVQICFSPSESNPIWTGKYSVKMYHNKQCMFQGNGIYCNGVLPILKHWVVQESADKCVHCLH
jgi:hypothetical protein